ncbi:MAG: cupin domain-containing protein [Marinifilaceae bacterium]
MERNQFNNGVLYLNGGKISTSDLQWNSHPAYHGVALKHLIEGATTNNEFSCHLVKIEPNCEIELHNHAGKTELHEVIQGSGICTLESNELEYEPGNVGILPADKNHSVKAGEQGLLLLAKFFPALL